MAEYLREPVPEKDWTIEEMLLAIVTARGAAHRKRGELLRKDSRTGSRSLKAIRDYDYVWEHLDKAYKKLEKRRR